MYPTENVKWTVNGMKQFLFVEVLALLSLHLINYGKCQAQKLLTEIHDIMKLLFCYTLVIITYNSCTCNYVPLSAVKLQIHCSLYHGH